MRKTKRSLYTQDFTIILINNEIKAYGKGWAFLLYGKEFSVLGKVEAESFEEALSVYNKTKDN